ncbi:hypothetical protein E1898_00095 [Algoriphagus formosus]|uniref:HTH LytTR-type domain-containing protein n=2 Tax=Algoriphagus formosus TaxID=2007308 RepID=A0A4R5VH24_9BACT|nr:hypothetical protein E1898_00095 [Algoriphagus aquimaris]
MWLVQLFKQPYPINSFRKMTWLAAIVSIFVFLFLSFFQPFGLVSDTWGALLKVTSMYGLITFFTMVLTTLGIRSLFPNYFLEKNWVFGRELLITLLYFFIIGGVNTLYSNYQFAIGLNLKGFLWFQFYTLGVGIFPILFFMMFKYTRLLSKNSKTANDLSGSLSKSIKSGNSNLHTKIQIHSELKKDDLEIFAEDLIYAETADNYIAIHHLHNGELQKSMVRSTLGRLETDVADYPHLVRCHRAFLVNLDFLESFKGNAQGLQLKLKSISNEIPVSRNRVGKIKELLD